MEIELKKINLGVSPQVLASIAKLDPSSSNIDFNQLENMLKSDQGMVTLILRVANSKFFAHGKQIKTLQHAIAVLGFRMLRSLAMLASTRALFGKNVYSRFKNRVWQPSIAAGLIAREIAIKSKRRTQAEECFIMGLLHKVGQVIFNVTDKSKFIQVLNELEKEERPSVEIERDHFGMDHMEIGRKAMEAWGLPNLYVEGIQYYGQLDKVATEVNQENQIFVYILGMASYILNSRQLGYEPDAEEKNLNIAQEVLELPDSELSYLTEVFPQKLTQNADYKYYISLL